jgi:acyl-coenzyme A thioesterase PaaI-like protein
MTLQNLLSLPAAQRQPQQLLNFIPYAKMMGVRAHVTEDSSAAILFRLDANEVHMGNPTLPAMHGGALSGFMELAAAVHLLSTMTIARYPKLIDFGIDYLSAARLETVFCICETLREGKNLTAVQVRAWQRDPAKPVAVGKAQFLCSDFSEA